MIATAAPVIAGSGPAAPFVAAGLGAATAAIALKNIGSGRKAADRFGREVTKPFETILARAAELQKTDPAAARAMVEQAWPKYLAQADQFAAKGSDELNVVRQNLTTPAFMGTVTSLLGKEPLDPNYTAPFLGKVGNVLAGAGKAVVGGLGKILPQIVSGTTKGTPGINPGATTPGTGPAGGGTTPTAPQTASPWAQAAPTLISTGANLLAGYLGSRAATRAANVQATASERAAELQAQTGREALQFSRDVFNQQRADAQPWMQAGTEALTQIKDIAGQPGFNREFTAPDPNEVLNNPAVKFQLEEGRKALEFSAAARGTSFSGSTIKDINKYAQGVASQEYDKLYNRARGEYETAYNVFSNERAARLNPLLSLAGLGQTATGQLNTAGSNAATTGGNIQLTTAGRVADSQTDAAAATASGYVGRANSWRDALAGVANTFTPLAEIHRQSRGTA